MDIVNCDVFEKDSKLFHLMVYHYSNYVWVKCMCQVTGHTVGDHLKHIFSEFGVTNTLISDHATYCMDEVFEQFCNEMDIQHKTTNTHSQHHNGKAERFVGTIKDMMYKADNTSLQDIITTLHDIPYSNEIQSPYRLMFNSAVKCNNLPTLQTAKEIVRKTMPGQELPPWKSDQVLDLEWPQDRIAHWKPTQITERMGERSYKVLTEEGKVLQRDRNQLRMDSDANYAQVKKEGAHKAEVPVPESTTDFIPLKVPRVILTPVDVKSQCVKQVHSQGSKAQAKNPGGSSIATNKLARDRKPPERLVYEIQVSKGSQVWDG